MVRERGRYAIENTTNRKLEVPRKKNDFSLLNLKIYPRCFFLPTSRFPDFRQLSPQSSRNSYRKSASKGVVTTGHFGAFIPGEKVLCVQVFFFSPVLSLALRHLRAPNPTYGNHFRGMAGHFFPHHPSPVALNSRDLLFASFSLNFFPARAISILAHFRPHSSRVICAA